MSATYKYTAAAYFIFDVESVGLHGEAFAVAAQVFDAMGEPIQGEGGWWHSTNRDNAVGTKENRDWIEKNVPPIKTSKLTGRDLRDFFWDSWHEAKSRYPGVVMAAECVWPVETNFLSACVADNPVQRQFEGPYPLHDIASIMMAAGMDPMATYERVHEEKDIYPAHHPLGDVKHSAWCLNAALQRLRGV
jgi:hypothetical protein